ncbi:MAG: NADPH:quinone oxidoreductase family protein [Candidatus Hydrogenedentes bacterium]|nr:NADPH:quinone oxidoreductase family protein [Candidatus Hydrogenedentota bacterium]
MQAWQVTEFGDFSTALQWTEIAPGAMGPDEVRIRVHAAGIMFADLLMVAGLYQVKPPLPFTPGAEAAGVVLEAGANTSFKPGDRVLVANTVGAFAEEVVAPGSVVYTFPEGMSFPEAAALTVNYQTSYFALAYRAALQPGETLLVHGGAGGVGTAAIQLGKAIGATVIATASSPEKLAACTDCGADHAIDYSNEDFVQVVKGLTGGRGADVILDPVGGEVFDKSTKCIAFEGRLLVIGFADGQIPSIQANRILLKNMSVVGLYWGNYQLYNPAKIAATQPILFKLYEEGKIKPLVDVHPMANLPTAMDLLRSRKVIGKAIVTNTF